MKGTPDWIIVLFICLCGLLALQGCGGARKQAIADARTLIEKSRHVPCEEIRSYLDQVDMQLYLQQKK